MKARGIQHQPSSWSKEYPGVRRGGIMSYDITTHSTEARVSWPFIRKTWMLDMLNARSVNSGVRFLLNAVAQNIESAVLNFDEAEDFWNANAA
jgi:hypothetical protein